MKNGSKDPDVFEERRLGLGVDPREKLVKIIPEFERESVILLPTDTIYGISCRWDSQAARDRVQRLKGPDRLAFFVSLISDREMAFRYAEQPSLECLEVLESAWPGPVTAILKLKPNAAPEFCASPEGTIAFRLPKSAFLQELIHGVGVPLVSTSANRSGEPHAESVDEAWQTFGEGIDLYIDAGPQEALPSTLVDLTGDRPKLLRVGIQALRGLSLEGDPFRE